VPIELVVVEDEESAEELVELVVVEDEESAEELEPNSAEELEPKSNIGSFSNVVMMLRRAELELVAVEVRVGEFESNSFSNAAIAMLMRPALEVSLNEET